MDRSLATLVSCHPETELQSALAWFVVVAVLITGSAASAESPELAKENLTDQSGRIMSMELNRRFSTLSEPSGIVPLSDGRFLVVEDEPKRTLRLISTAVSGGVILVDDESHLKLPPNRREQLTPGIQDDLEGTAHDQKQQGATLPSSTDQVFEWKPPELDIELKLEAQRSRGQEANLDYSSLESEVVVKVRQQLPASVMAQADLILQSTSYSKALEDVGTSETLYSFEQLYIEQWNAGENYRWRLGRQSLEDDMGWVIDEELDGLRFTNRSRFRKFDLSFSRKQWMVLGNEKREDNIDNVLGQLSFEIRENTVWSPYFLVRKDHGFDGSRPSENTWLGVQGIARINSNLGYWLNATIRNGREDLDSGTLELGGQAVDAGITWSLNSRFDPSFTVGYARGSGDSDVTSTRNDTFRQSDLHSNKFRLNGRNRFRYLGEVVDPELSNISIVTIGAGAKLRNLWELDIAYHRYAQIHSVDRLDGSDIEFDPAGVDGDLGDEIDFVLGYQHSEELNMQGLLGLFRPGTAFENAEDAPDPLKDVWLVRLEIEYEF